MYTVKNPTLDEIWPENVLIEWVVLTLQAGFVGLY